MNLQVMGAKLQKFSEKVENISYFCTQLEQIKHNRAMKHYFFYPLFAVFAMAFFSCSNDSGENDGSGNTTDIAVTGRITETGMTYALAEGYVNLDKLTAGYESAEIGIGVKSSDSDREQYFKTQGVEGRKISVMLSSLNPATTYTFRTYVRIGSIYQYGEQKTFTTKEGRGIATTGTAKDIALFSAKLSADANWEGLGDKESISVVIGYSQNREELTTSESLVKYNYYTYEYSFRQGTEERGFFVSNGRKATLEQEVNQLAAGTHYYYCAFTMLGSTIIASDIKEFSTPDATKYVITGSASDIKQCTATVDARFDLTSLYGSTDETLSYSVIYATSAEELAVENKRVEVVTDGGKTTLYPLLPNTTYYYQTKARIGDNHIALGEVKTLTTNDIQHNGAVDLGTSRKWATFNIGSNSPEMVGNRYAYGEMDTKDDFYPGNYAYNLNDLSSSAYRPRNYDNSGTEFDTATQLWGDSWRMPTTEEVNELNSKCKFLEGSYNGTRGHFVTSENGNAVFFPVSNSGLGTYLTANFNTIRIGQYSVNCYFVLDKVYVHEYNAWNGFFIRPVQ